MRQEGYIKAPRDKDTQNDYGVRKFTVTTSSQIHELPAAWAGRIVHLRIIAAAADTEMHYGFSTRSDSIVDAAEAATAPGASVEVGWPILPGEIAPEELPDIKPGEKLYFVRDGSAAATCYIRLAN
jgi:hypothetical protein